MSRGINKEDEFELYMSGLSITEVHEKTSIPLSTLRFRFKKAGILRSRKDGVLLAAKKGKLSWAKGTTRTFTSEWKDNISKSQIKRHSKTKTGTSLKPSGYLEITSGKLKGKSVHVAVMESFIGRPLHESECVHHIDRDKTNNNINNLALMTRSAHSRLHKFEDELSNTQRRRNANGTWA